MCFPSRNFLATDNLFASVDDAPVNTRHFSIPAEREQMLVSSPKSNVATTLATASLQVGSDTNFV